MSEVLGPGGGLQPQLSWRGKQCSKGSSWKYPGWLIHNSFGILGNVQAAVGCWALFRGLLCCLATRQAAHSSLHPRRATKDLPLARAMSAQPRLNFQKLLPKSWPNDVLAQNPEGRQLQPRAKQFLSLTFSLEVAKQHVSCWGFWSSSEVILKVWLAWRDEYRI